MIVLGVESGYDNRCILVVVPVTSVTADRLCCHLFESVHHVLLEQRRICYAVYTDCRRAGNSHRTPVLLSVVVIIVICEPKCSNVTQLFS